jgi:hypothetical protein
VTANDSDAKGRTNFTAIAEAQSQGYGTVRFRMKFRFDRFRSDSGDLKLASSALVAIERFEIDLVQTVSGLVEITLAFSGQIIVFLGQAREHR